VIRSVAFVIHTPESGWRSARPRARLWACS
jgi:hypothetical protein